MRISTVAQEDLTQEKKKPNLLMEIWTNIYFEDTNCSASMETKVKNELAEARFHCWKDEGIFARNDEDEDGKGQGKIIEDKK